MKAENVTDPDDWETFCSLCEEKKAPLLKLSGHGCGCESYTLICDGCARYIVDMFEAAQPPIPAVN